LTQGLQAGAEPGGGGLFSLSRAPDAIGLAAHAALAGGALDELLGAVHLVLFQQVVVLALQVRTRLGRVVPAAIALEPALRAIEAADQLRDLALRLRAGRGVGEWR